MEDTIWLAGGNFVHARTVWNVFKGKHDVLQYQVIQHEPDRFELKLVTLNREAYERILNPVLSQLSELLGPSAKVESAFYPELPRERGGKFRPVISNCKPVEYA
jgi:hypothetical protein